MNQSKASAPTDYKALEKILLRINLVTHVKLYPILLPYAGICIELERKDRLVQVLFSNEDDGFILSMDNVLSKYYANSQLQEQWLAIRDQMPTLDTEAMFHLMYTLWGMEDTELDDIWAEMKQEASL